MRVQCGLPVAIARWESTSDTFVELLKYPDGRYTTRDKNGNHDWLGAIRLDTDEETIGYVGTLVMSGLFNLRPKWRRV